MEKFDNSGEKKRLSAICGLFCKSCSVYIGSTEEPERLKTIAEKFDGSVEDWRCEGCRSEKRSCYCEHECKLAPCAKEKELDFCGECDDYPCEEFKIFQAERPHRIELFEAQDRIADVGYETWFDEMIKHYSCVNCGTINAAHDISCRKCGKEPGCEYVRRHKDIIIKYISETP